MIEHDHNEPEPPRSENLRDWVRDLWKAVFGFEGEGGLRRRVKELEDEAEKIPVLRTEVQLLTKAVDRQTNALYTVVGTIVATGVVAYLGERGVIG